MENKAKNQAIKLLKSGLDYQSVSAKTGVGVPMLRTWKSRYLQKEKAESTAAAAVAPKAKPKTQTITKTQTPITTSGEVEPVQASNKKLELWQNDALFLAEENVRLGGELEMLQHQVLRLDAENEVTCNELITARSSVETLTMENAALTVAMSSTAKPNDTPLIVAVVALHLSAVYGVGEILSDVFHTYVMGYLTAAVFVSAGLVMFASNKFSIGVSWLVLCATFLLESYCNYLTIYMKMEGEQLAQYQQYTNTDLLFFCIAVFVPLVNLALEYLLFKPLVTE